MNQRERFIATMHYQPVDRSPIMDFGFWRETLPVWHDQGLPESVNQENSEAFFGMDVGPENMARAVGATPDLAPSFEHVILEDYGDQVLEQQEDGVRVLRRKFMGSIPQPQEHLLVDRESWRKHYVPKLDPENPARYPADWDERVAFWLNPERDVPIALQGGSLYGRIRNWVGMEKLAYIIYDDPAFFEEMVITVTDCIIGTLTRCLETGAKFEGCSMWEDMAYNAGPLISPRHFKKYLVPQYRRITDLLHKHDVDVCWVDCDGNIELLMPHWLDAGINCMFPLEIGTWGADPLKYRKEYGREMLIMGGFDKHILAESKKAIEAEVHRLTPLVEEGGYIGFCDHRVPPDVPYENYLHYLSTVRTAWGKDVDLQPVQWRYNGQS